MVPFDFLKQLTVGFDLSKSKFMGHHKRISGASARTASVAFGVVLLLSGCTNIWNASDLAVWVEDRAVAQGCLRETIELDEWYEQTPEGNVWRGTCRDPEGEHKTFGINVDSVWTPSASAG